MNSLKESIKNTFRKRFSYATCRGFYVLVTEFFHINILKTVYFNLRALPLSQAYKLPFIIGYHVRIKKIGKIKIECPVNLAMISLGVINIPHWEDRSEGILIFNNHGSIIFKGMVKFYPASKLFVEGEVVFSGNNNIGSRTLMVSYKNIQIGYNTGCSWDCEITDTNFHPLKDIVGDRFVKQEGKIVIGDNVFIGNHTNIAKNTNIPNGCVISSWSNVSGNFKREGDNLLISGNPARIIDKGYQMYDFCQFKI